MLFVVLSLMFTLACSRTSVAQVADYRDPLGPVACFDLATNRVATFSALALCAGAPSDAPARCMTEALAQGTLTSQDAVLLCRGAMSTDPSRCFERLSDTTAIDKTRIIDYCAAPLAFAPTIPASSTACVEAALDEADLWEQITLTLCRGSTSAAPVSCFTYGRDVIALTDHDLATLCSPASSWEYRALPYDATPR